METLKLKHSYQEAMNEDALTGGRAARGGAGFTSIVVDDLVVVWLVQGIYYCIILRPN